MIELTKRGLNMRFTIVREEFLKGLTIVGRAIAAKNPVAVLSNIKLELGEEGLVLTGSNYDLSIKTLIPFKKPRTAEFCQSERLLSRLLG